MDKEDEIVELLLKRGRPDLYIHADSDSDEELDPEDCVNILIGKYPVKKIFTKVYKANESPNHD
mgnify:FL=1|tara:strand:+ start:252 stop:443 length:192 start_codon:yes stop_codon:yes gene_type:complete